MIYLTLHMPETGLLSLKHRIEAEKVMVGRKDIGFTDLWKK